MTISTVNLNSRVQVNFPIHSSLPMQTNNVQKKVFDCQDLVFKILEFIPTKKYSKFIVLSKSFNHHYKARWITLQYIKLMGKQYRKLALIKDDLFLRQYVIDFFSDKKSSIQSDQLIAAAKKASNEAVSLQFIHYFIATMTAGFAGGLFAFVFDLDPIS